MGSNTLHNDVFQLLCRKDFETPVDYNSATVLYCLRLFCDVKKGRGNAATGNNSKVQSFGSVFNLLLSISLHIAFIPSFLLI